MAKLPEFHVKRVNNSKGDFIGATCASIIGTVTKTSTMAATAESEETTGGMTSGKKSKSTKASTKCKEKHVIRLPMKIKGI